MKYLKNFQIFNLNEGVPGGIGAVVGGIHKSKAATKQEASDDPDKFLCSVLVNPLLKKWGAYNVVVTDCDIDKQEKKEGFFKKLFSSNSVIKFTLKSESLKNPIEMSFELKGDKFKRMGDSGNDRVTFGYIDDEHQDKFIKWVLTQSKWKDDLKKNFEDIEKTFTKESF